MPTMNELISKEFGIRRTLLGKYANLEVYHEVEEIIAEKLEQGINSLINKIDINPKEESKKCKGKMFYIMDKSLH